VTRNDKSRLLLAFLAGLSAEVGWYGVAVLLGLCSLIPWDFQA
jgi:hypothetical protein